MQRGTITILIILGVALVAATASVLYHYSNQRRAQQFWGTQTAALIDKAPLAEVMRLGAAEFGLALESEDETQEPAAEPRPEDEAPRSQEEEPAAKALEFNGMVWEVVESKDAAPAKGISNLRRALVLDTTYNWSEETPAEDPSWQYALGVTDGRDWATVLFDFESRQVALAGARRTAMLVPEAAEEFMQFFEGQFTKPPDEAESPEDGAASIPPKSEATETTPEP